MVPRGQPPPSIYDRYSWLRRRVQRPLYARLVVHAPDWEVLLLFPPFDPSGEAAEFMTSPPDVHSYEYPVIVHITVHRLLQLGVFYLTSLVIVASAVWIWLPLRGWVAQRNTLTSGCTLDRYFYNMPPATGTIALNNCTGHHMKAILQAKGKLASLSWYDTSAGPAHAPEWTSACKIDGKAISSGKGTHKHISRDCAAELALAILMREWA
ncbi:hypothetical protein B0F90DRAFT_1832509 [Multifurca ochricompacta]|uniref:DRBM domain-containing protein n=1 Tax=Multifurca ochricompacta TaxID=376703 RepID=A0AAD4MGA6_9AGAM|nr:hypothetical protein B0F90DRAFT_1832509 [Multifurca ochricompacta]